MIVDRNLPSALAAFIDQVLDGDRRAPRKQRHTARRIYRRILAEFPDATVAESTVPSVADLDALNALLLTGCRADEHGSWMGARSQWAWRWSPSAITCCRAPEGFDLADVTCPLVDKQGCVVIKTNAYSVPVKAGTRVEARVYPLHVET